MTGKPGAISVTTALLARPDRGRQLGMPDERPTLSNDSDGAGELQVLRFPREANSGTDGSQSLEILPSGIQVYESAVDSADSTALEATAYLLTHLYNGYAIKPQ